ncbi:MAG: nitroreductase family protein [Defluviitaleaceae bacterium]|nr:nitroreductase family protein [Defluviitaleaceae bacterium]
MEFFEVLEQRYSHKEKFLADSVPLADLEKIATAGLLAPSGVNRQSARLIILPDRKMLDLLCEISATAGLETAPAAIAVFTDKTVTPPDRMNFEKEDYSAAVENMLLAAVALGYASLWLDSPFFDPQNEEKAKIVLNIPVDKYKLWAVLPIGKPSDSGSRRDKLPFGERVSYAKYGLGK